MKNVPKEVSVFMELKFKAEVKALNSHTWVSLTKVPLVMVMCGSLGSQGRILQRSDIEADLAG